MGAEALPSLYDDSYPRYGCSGSCGGDRSRNGDLDAGIPLVPAPRVGGRLSLERTGPYIPPITLPGIGDIVLTSEARKRLEGSGLAGFGFVPVEKTLIVELHWDAWNLDADAPPEFPDSGEPEDYVLGKRHSATAAEALGESGR